MIKTWLIMFSGFMQRAGQMNGTVRVWRELSRLSSPDCQVLRLPWNADVADLAELIARMNDGQKSQPRIVLMGYSWGGMTAVNLAWQLQRRGLDVDRMVLCDAVYRHWYPLGWWRAFAAWRSIRVPENVRHVAHARQWNSWPSGHRVVPCNPVKTEFEPAAWLNTDHSWADDSFWFLEHCSAAAHGVNAYDLA